MSHYINLDRRFWPIEADNENDPETIRTLSVFGDAPQLLWNNLVERCRVVILAEPGTGKTEELRAAAKRLQAAGKLAFFCRIELLQSLEVRQTFDIGTSSEFDNWLRSDQEGWFFLDSVDEAKLSSHLAFEIGLRRFAAALGESLNRAKVVVTCRVSNWRATADLSMFLSSLPTPEIVKVKETEAISAGEDELDYEETVADDKTFSQEERKDHVVFQLLPLNESQIRCFAAEKGVVNTDDFIEAIERSDAMIFAERPQDLLELIAFWKSNGRLGQHAEMLEFNIQVKLAEHDSDRDDRRPLSPDDAVLGAECIAAASTLGRKNAIILPDRPIDPDLRNASIEPKEVLPSWSSDKINTLLDRAIFDEAIYGTVRFHHRSVREYLTAKWLRRLLEVGKSRRSVEGLLFAKRYGREVVIPTMRPVAAWLAIWDERVRSRLRTIAPEVLIENGDPSALPVEFRKSLLVGFAEVYAERQYTGASFDITMIRRLADPQLASTVNDLLVKFGTHDDICTLLLKLIWQGQMPACVDAALAYALDNRANDYTRICAIRAVHAAGTQEQHHGLVNALLAEMPSLNSHIIGEICEAFFPDILSVGQLLEILEAAEPPEQYSSSPLLRSVETIAKASISEEVNEHLLRGLHRLLKSPPFIERRHCEISERYAWLLPSAMRLANQFLKKKHPFSFDPIVLDIYLGFFTARDYHDFLPSEKEKIVKEAKDWLEFRRQLFWHTIAATRAQEEGKDKITEWWQITWRMRDFWIPGTDDLEQLFEALDRSPLMDDRLVALSAIFYVYIQDGRSRQLCARMKRAVQGTPELEARLQELLHPKPLSDEHKKWRRQDRDYKRRQSEREKQQQRNRYELQQALKKNPEEIKNVGNAERGEIWRRTAYLYDRMREKKKSHGKLGYPNWKALIDEFGYDVAKNFRDGCVAYWRKHDPFTYPDRRTSNTIPWPRMIGLTGLAMEAADDSEWAERISTGEGMMAAHYSVCELNGFPPWFTQLSDRFPDLVDRVIIDELRWEIHEGQAENGNRHTLSALRSAGPDFPIRYRQVLFDLLSEKEPTNDLVLDHTLSLILQGDIDTAFRQRLSDLACMRFKESSNPGRKFTWLVAMLSIDGDRGTELLKEWIAVIPSEEKRKAMMINFCSAFTHYGDPRFSRSTRDYERIDVLNELLPLIYRFVKVEEDNHHEGSYSPDNRDQAERTRSHLLGVIANTPGRSSYDALENLSKSISNSYSRDRIHYLAKERAAMDAEFEPWPATATAEFALSAEKQPRTEAELYEIALARLDELRMDIEDGDESEAVLLQKLTRETEIRIVFANRLRKSSRSYYTVGSEEELADATRTDIRLNAPQVAAPVPIELKIAGNWTLTELRERLENQLIGQYMRTSHYGIFLVVHNGKGRKMPWKDPLTPTPLSFSELIEMLNRDAVCLIEKYPNVSALEVVGIDFLARGVHKTKAKP
jgi:hypothetical protein